MRFEKHLHFIIVYLIGTFLKLDLRPSTFERFYKQDSNGRLIHLKVDLIFISEYAVLRIR